MAYSNSNATFSGYEGTIAYMTLNIPAAIAYGSYTVQLKNIRIVTEAQHEIRLADTTAAINVNKVSGDANGNGYVNISDAVATVNYILGRTPDKFRFEAADTNNDGKISLIDVVNIIDLILNPVAEQQTGRSYKRAATSSETLTADDATSTDGRLALPVAFNNTNAYTALQMDVELPAGATLESATLGDRASSHSVTWSKISDRKARIIAYSLSNATIDGTNGTLLTLNLVGNDAVDGTVAIVDAVAATADGTETAIGGGSANIGINGTTGIGTTTADGLNIYVADGALIVESSEATTLAVYTTDGRLADRLQVAPGKNSYTTFEAGMYIIGGKKIVIK